MNTRLVELAALFLKLGTIGFGGPAVHIATMEEEVVHRRQWLTREHFLDLVGATNLIPGPNSTEMAIHIGYVRAGFVGLLVAGGAFIFPAVVITTALAWFYVQFGQTPQLTGILFGIKPAVLAIIFTAGWRLTTKAINSWPAAVLALIVMTCSLRGVSEILLIVVAGVFGMLWLAMIRRNGTSGGNASGAKVTSVLLGLFSAFAAKTCRAMTLSPLAVLKVGASGASTVSLWKLALVFLKVGLVLYGTGYVLLAYLEGELVEGYGWLTQERLVEAIAIGQLTPGPILSTATFIGYVVMAQSNASPNHLAGLAGAIVATVCIFLPSFVFVALTNPLVPKLRKNRLASLLDSVNAASMGLMAAITLKLSRHIFVPTFEPLAIDWPSVFIATVAVVAVWRWKISPIWLVIGGATAGSLFSLFCAVVN